MRTVGTAVVIPEQFGRRRDYRFPVMLPAYVELDGLKFNARLVNLGRSGALIETSEMLATETAIILRCGTIAVAAIAIWGRGHRFGLRFVCPLTSAQIQEQLSRRTALTVRRDR